MRMLRSAAVAVAFGFVIGGLAGPALAQAGKPQLGPGALLTAGEINFAADFAAAPNQFMDAQGKMDGLNPAMCGEVAKKLGLNIKWTNLAFPGLVPGLQAKRFDALCTAIFINPERKQIMNMIAYVQWGEGLMVPVANPLGIKCSPNLGNDASFNPCFDPLAGKKVSVAVAGTTQKNLKEHGDRLKAAGKVEIDVKGFDTNADTIQALASGQVDAAYVNGPQGHFYINRNPGKFVMAFDGNKANRLALATLKENVALAEALRWALGEMKKDGSYQKIIKAWGVAEVADFALNP